MVLKGALWRKIKKKRTKENNYIDLEKEQEAFTGKKWEYRVIVLNIDNRGEIKASENWTDKLCELGKNGWELVAVIPMVAQLGFLGMPPHVRCFFKREIK
jgi:hypothetical protein